METKETITPGTLATVVHSAGGGAPGGRRRWRRAAPQEAPCTSRESHSHSGHSRGHKPRRLASGDPSRGGPMPGRPGERGGHPASVHDPGDGRGDRLRRTTWQARGGGRGRPCPRRSPRNVNGTPASGGGRRPRAPASCERGDRAGDRAGWPAPPRAASGVAGAPARGELRATSGGPSGVAGAPRAASCERRAGGRAGWPAPRARRATSGGPSGVAGAPTRGELRATSGGPALPCRQAPRDSAQARWPPIGQSRSPPAPLPCFR